MAMNYKDANKILTRALFMLEADTFERRFMTSTSALRDLYTQILRIAFPQVTFEPSPSDKGIVLATFEGLGTDLSEMQFSVYNLYAQLDPEDAARSKDDVVAHIIASVTTMGQAMTAEKDAHLKGQLIALVGSDRMLADFEAQAGGGTAFVTWKISENLNAIVAVDGKKTVAYLQQEDLRTLGLSEEQVREKVVATMRRRMSKTRPEFQQADNGILLVGGYEGWTQSLLVLEEFTQSFRHRLGEDVVFHVSDDMIVVAGRSNAEAITTMIHMVDVQAVDAICPGSYFFVDAEGVCTLGRKDVIAILEAAPDEQGYRGGPTLN